MTSEKSSPPSMSESSQNTYIEDALETIANYESDISPHCELIKDILQEQLKESDLDKSKQAITRPISDVLYASTEDRDVSDEIAGAIFGYLLVKPDNNYKILKDSGLSKEMTEYLYTIKLRYQTDILRIYLSNRQGKEYWTNIEGDYVYRPSSNTIGIDYTIEKHYSEFIEITTSVESNLELILRLLEEEKGAIRYFGRLASEQINQQTIDDIESSIEDIKQDLKEIEEENKTEEIE